MAVRDSDKRVLDSFLPFIPVLYLLEIVLTEKLDKFRSSSLRARDFLVEEVSKLIVVCHLADFHESNDVSAVLVPIKKEEFIHSCEWVKLP